MENTAEGCEATRAEPPANSRGLVSVSWTKSQSSICRIKCAQFSWAWEEPDVTGLCSFLQE
ncbi:hypothetical protein E2C01_091192 [Portunus trituberculatus]|uniref:Uncharacterized protein n=1 Tax=Portunus trituberculatus TaxID=210409 RepID=A0A5B7JII2_PORTR|nr:hypothetical protein [Portunus trituberculatus]